MKHFYFSRKTFLLGLLSFLLFSGGEALTAQEIFTEHFSADQTGSTKFQPTFDVDTYTKTQGKKGDQIFIKNQNSVPSSSQNKISDGNLNVNFNYDTTEYYISSLLVFNESGYRYAADYYSITNPLLLNIPTGNYDIITEFSPLNAGQTHTVIKEQQNVQTNTTVQVNPTEAVNHFSITGYNENGDLFPAGVSGYFSFQRSLYFNPTDFVTIGDYFFTSPVDGQEPEWNFYINNVSNRYSFIQSLIGTGFPEGTYFTKFKTVTGVNNDISIANNPADWSHHTQKFQRTKVGNTLASANFTASAYKGKLLNGWRSSAGGEINPGDDPFRGYVSNRRDGDLADLIVTPAIIDHYIQYSPTTGGIEFFTKANPVFSDGTGKILYGSGDVSFNSHADPLYATFPYLSDDYYRVANNETLLFPVHPKFSFDNMTSPSVILGNNVPITVTGFENNKLKITNKGRYGETRETDYLATQIELKQNGNSIISGYLNDFTNSLPSSGDIEIILTNANTLIEGLQGKNTTTISYNATDLPPTLQHLQFRNLNNEVTNTFDSTQGATVRLAAGDFKYNSIGANGYFSYEAGNNVALSYSKYNQNIWAPLGVTKYPEFFQMPAFGDYYEGSLEGIAKESTNVWYDLKVICTDENGNKQEQIISPAFKRNGTLAVENNSKSSFSVYPNPFSETINIKIPDDIKGSYTFKVTDLTGKTIYTKSQSNQSFSWNGSFLIKGVYILTIENSGKIIAEKVMKK
ncbi:T9SS type A sorting domain-containing protein [Kaistella sp. G5-32]|uniref:T9SS type A sorting domain-containing protein n=1 Tax=Kaistella gelatinilytica TaxID=2787636 RepID=A0ABS0FBH4_9FLAO|nr:T9SS type A sorting domain-containing protein [Kaistella gelatinilytica]MBF8457005.1 T9SS type A sorting domain-containing protein [Kaistella gelatinilytica]